MNDLFDHRILREQLFALIDASMLEWLPAGLPLETLVPANLAASAHLMPKLLSLRNLPEQQRHALLDSIHQAMSTGDQPAVALFVKTSADLAAFVRQWNVAQVCEPTRGQKAWLRLHDPRVLHQLLRILPPSQRKRFFSNAQSLTYWIGREWVTVSLREDALHGGCNPAKPAEPFLENHERLRWDRIGRIGIINRALHGATVRHASALTSQGMLAEQLIDRAYTTHGLIDPADLVEFATRGLTISSAFDEHPVILAAIKPAMSFDDDSTLADRLAIISEQVWSELYQSQRS